MNVTGVDAHESLSDVAYHTFRCTACGDVERRLLARTVLAQEILAVPDLREPLPTPREAMRLGPAARSFGTASNHILKNARYFISTFVRDRSLGEL